MAWIAGSSPAMTEEKVALSPLREHPPKLSLPPQPHATLIASSLGTGAPPEAFERRSGVWRLRRADFGATGAYCSSPHLLC
jgi:hypothetical protein